MPTLASLLPMNQASHVLRWDALTLYNATVLVHSYRALTNAPIDFIVSSWSLRVSKYFGQLPQAAYSCLTATYRPPIAAFSCLRIMCLGSSQCVDSWDILSAASTLCTMVVCLLTYYTDTKLPYSQISLSFHLPLPS